MNKIKLFLVILLLFSLFSCEKSRGIVYEIKVEVHYPSRVDTLTFKEEFLAYPKVTSHEGTNVIIKGDPYDMSYDEPLLETTAPVSIVSVEKY